eukprot:9864877-Lingulodinium_polyedra.AAC.1
MLEKVRGTLLEQAAMLVSLVQAVWASLGGVCGLDPGFVRTKVLNAAHTSIGYCSQKSLFEAQRLP